MFRWVVENRLARGRRPGYGAERGRPVPQGEVDAWLNAARDFGVRSIICLLAEDQLRLYATLPSGLVAYYEISGFVVAHVPARDHQLPPLPEGHLVQIWEAYELLPKPVLVHCSAGVDRTGRAIEYITQKMGLPAEHALAADSAARSR